MATVLTEVEVEVDLENFGDSELIEEMKYRGFFVSKQEQDITEIELDWNRGAKKEALILLERKFPELCGISNLID